MYVLLFLAAVFAATGAYSDVISENQEIVEIVDQILQERGLHSDLDHEIKELKGQLHKYDIKIEHMEREIGELQQTVENQRSQKQELLALNLKQQQQITSLEMDVNYLKAVLPDRNGNKEILATGINDDPRTLGEHVDTDEAAKHSHTGNMKTVSKIDKSQHKSPVKILDENPLRVIEKAKANEKWGENIQKLAQKSRLQKQHKGLKHELQNDFSNDNHKDVQTQLNRLRRHVNTSHIAFSTYLGHNIPHTAPGHTIKFDEVLLNDGNGYNFHTGIFTAKVTGVYLFTFNIAVYDPEKWIWVKLVVDNRNIVDAAAGAVHGVGSHTMSGNTAIVQVNENESVWLEAYGSLDGELISDSGSRITTFSGILMYAN